MVKSNSFYPVIVTILFIAVIVFAGLYFTKTPRIEKVDENSCSEFINKCPEIPEKKAMVFAVLNSWGENLYDSSEYLLAVDVFNFGEIEAKNVEVECEILVGDEDGYQVSDVAVSTVKKRIGNIASTSYKYAELELEKDTKKEGTYPLATCSVTYCENCNNLNDLIPELN